MARGKKGTRGGASEGGLTQDQVVAHALIRDIVDWKIPPGTWLRERAIADRFEVSHAPVREALRQLTNIGLVEVHPWRGARVIEVDRHKSIEVLELWKALFGVVCRLACDVMTRQEGEELLVRVATYRDIVRQTRNTFAHLEVSNSIGSYIARRCGAPLAKQLLDRVALLARWQHHVISDTFMQSLPEGMLEESADIYERLCGHIIENQPDEADQAARDLIAVMQVQFSAALDQYLAEARAQATEKAPSPRKRS